MTKHIRVMHVPRHRDDRVLSWLARRSAGESANSIGRSEGVAPGQVILATNKVMHADIEQSGEPEDIISKEYW